MLSRQLGRVHVASMLFVLFLSSAGMNLETSQAASLATHGSAAIKKLSGDYMLIVILVEFIESEQVTKSPKR